MISLELSADQEALQQKIRSLAKEKLQPYSLELDKKTQGPMDPEFRRIMAREGLNAFLIPKELGGKPLDRLTLALVTEEIGYGCAGFASIYASTVHAVSALLIAGSHEQKSEFLPLLLSDEGDVAGCAITEEKSGSDTTSFSTTAHSEGDHYMITGSKCPIINAGYASFYVVWASSDTGRGRAGINAFVVPGDAAGLSFGPYHEKPGLRCTPTAGIFFDRVVVPGSNLIGLPGSGYLLLMQTLDLGRAFFGAICVGLGRAALEESIHFAKNRIILGRPIIENQGIGFLLAELATELDAARLLVWRACRLMDLDLDYSKESSMAKLMASEAAVRITTEGTQILGQRGYINASPMDKYQRDAQALRILEGTSQIQKIIIASQL